jgi:hypothetical protein
MAMRQLLARLEDLRLSEFAEAWQSARRGVRVPRWRDIDIGRMASCLPYAWAWELDRSTGFFRGKLAGEEILNVVGRGLRGSLAHEYYKGRRAELILSDHRRVILEQVGAVASGRIFWHAGSYAVGQRLSLPVASRSDEADTVLGVTLYRFAMPLPAEMRADIGIVTAEFFSLDE